MKTITKAVALAALTLGAVCMASLSSPAQAAARPAAPAEAPAPAQHVLTSLLAAIKADDYAAFTADAEAVFKNALTKPMLDQVSAAETPRLKKGYRAAYLGELNQKGYRVYLWKLTYTDGGDDSLVSLSLKAGKVGGFFIN